MIYSPLEIFELGILFKIIYLTDHIDLSFSNLSFFLVILVVSYYIVYKFIFKVLNYKILLNPIQNYFNKVFLFIFSLIKDNLKLKDVIYFSLLLTLFQLILFSNVMGIFPYTFTVTGHLVVTFSIAFSIFLGLNIVGFRIHKSYILNLLLPKGIDLVIAWLLIMIEFISYNFRVVSLSVRLFANIMAGHTLLAVIFGSNYYLIGMSSTNFLILFLPLVLLPSILLILALICLEFGVALIQSYVFTLLSTMYLHDAKYLH